MKPKKYDRLSRKEREVIQELLEQKKTQEFIAKTLKRSPSTISREVRRPEALIEGKYNAEFAQFWAEHDKHYGNDQSKIERFSKLRFYVFKGLLMCWTPEQIALRIKKDYPNDHIMSISHESIYAYIYKSPQSKMGKKLIKLLTRKRVQRKKLINKKHKGSKIKNRTTIGLRPSYINDRLEFGHWEGDLVIGKRHGSCIGTLVERMTRFTIIVPIKYRDSKHVTQQFTKYLKRLPKSALKTLTYDNGMEMARHQEFTEKTGMTVYFANPYSSWERGTNENTNGRLRRFFPKGTDFNQIENKQLQKVQDIMNNTPRKILHAKTPNECVYQQLNAA